MYVVTFDQILYANSADIVAGELSSVAVGLGGFHLLMSFMGAVGYIMGKIGLNDLWSFIYANESIGRMLTGQAYSRALRAHYLTQSALSVAFMNAI